MRKFTYHAGFTDYVGCSTKGCDGTHHAQGLCGFHWAEAIKAEEEHWSGVPLPPAPTDAECAAYGEALDSGIACC